MTKSRIVVVCGNPKRGSRTLNVAIDIATEIADGDAPSDVLDLIDLGADLLSWGTASVTSAVETVRTADVAVIGSPTYKASYTGLLKVFLDHFDAGSLHRVVAVPVMLGGGWRHALAPEVHLRPVLVELGAVVPTSALYLLDGEVDGPTRQTWLDQNRDVIRSAVDALRDERRPTTHGRT